MSLFCPRALTGTLAVACALAPWQVLALPDSYLDVVKADVEEFSSGAFVAPGDTAWTGGAEAGADDGTASLASFEDFLKNRFRGTYILFRGLSEAQKIQVWQDYVKTGDLGGIRSNIFAMRRVRGQQASRPSISNLPLD